MSRSGVERAAAAADPRIERLLESEGAERERAIGELIAAVARPQARRAVSRYARGEGLTHEDAEDIVATVELRLLAKLRGLTATDEDAILDFEQYVSKLAFNILSDHFRRRFPERTRLKNRLRYTLTHDARMALWSAGDRLTCGLAEWQGASAARSTSLSIPMRDRGAPAAALLAIFRAAGRAIDFEDLIDRLADEWHVVDAARFETAPAFVPAVDADYETREILAALWHEVLDLRPMQRKALLLNLRDADTAHVLSLFVLAGVASVDTIAAALEMPRRDLEAMWNDLPLDDLRIAAMLGITRQQVINLRKSARERLTRRVTKRRPS